jgi:hypothetical protein
MSAIERSLAKRGWLGYESREAPAASREALVSVHSAEYVDAVRSMSDRGGGAFDDETVLSPGSYRAEAHAAGAACAMVEALLAGGHGRVGFCAARPPGHHGRQAGLARTAAFRLLTVADMEAGELIDASEVRRLSSMDSAASHRGIGTPCVSSSCASRFCCARFPRSWKPTSIPSGACRRAASSSTCDYASSAARGEPVKTW